MLKQDGVCRIKGPGAQAMGFLDLRYDNLNCFRHPKPDIWVLGPLGSHGFF